MKFSFADRLKDVDEYYFSRKMEEISHLNLQGPKVINLGIGSPDLGPDKAVINETITHLKSPQSHGYASYRSLPELRVAFSNWYKKNYDVDLDPEAEILPLLGSKEGIFYLSMSLLSPGDQVLAPNPGYLAYRSAGVLCGAEVISYDLKENNKWLPDLAALEKTDLSRCKLMWINYPHMPTGATINESGYKKIINFCKKRNIILCNDNPYSKVLNEDSPLSILSVDKEKEVSVELNSLSKSFNMAGWRVGVMAGPSEIMNAVIKVKSNVDSGMFLPLQHGAIAALNLNEEFHQDRNEVYRKRRALVWEIFDSLGFTYSKDQVGLFVWAQAPSVVSNVSEYMDEILLQARVFITPGEIFGSNGKRFARASLCASEEMLKEGKSRIQKFISKDHI